MEFIEKEKMTMTPRSVTLVMVTLEELSTLLAAQHSDQERYALAEKIIIDRVTHRDGLLDKIKSLIRPSLPQQLLFLEENVGNPQDTTFEWYTGNEGMGSGAQATEGQG